MSNFPNALDDDSVIPAVNDNITEIGGLVVNALRDATFAMQENIGLVAQGSTSSISERLGVSLFPDGTIKASALTGLGLVTLPITEDQISASAEIPESKLKLDHRTQDLFNYILDLSGDVNQALGWISATGVKLEPHLVGQIYKHSLSHINVSTVSSEFLSNNLRLFRNNSNSYELIKDINAELLAHQWADGSDFGPDTFIITNNGSTYSSHYGHTASGIFLNTSGFSTIPQTATDLQEFAEFIDGASIFLLGSRLQNLYSNGISRESRSSSLITDGYGTLIIPPIPAIAYLKNIGNNSGPFDDINSGDDIIELRPPQAQLDDNSFDEKFALVHVGDIIRINYGTVEASFIIKERKYIQNGGNKQFVVRIAGKNLQYSPNASIQINRTLVNTNKYGVLALAAANSNVSIIPSSLIIASPRSAQTLGIGFNANQFDNSHYALYLALYPTGIPDDGYVILPGIDVTGNQGATPGAYTLDFIVDNTNNQFRKIGYNYRFIAYQYDGEFGIALADSYNNAAFSILSAVVATNGTLDPVGTGITFPNNVVGMFASVNFTAPDPLGFGPLGANVASPAYQGSYPSAEAAISPTKIFLPLRRNSYYVNGTEREKLNTDIDQAIDSFGDGYWVGTIVAQTIIPGTPGTVQTTYRIPFDLSASQLKKGKTIVVQSSDGYGNFPNDFGRFIISDVAIGCCSPSEYTDIKVYDAVHGLANSGTTGLALGIGGEVAIYFSSDSVALNNETATDFSSVSPFKRHFETYIDENSNSFTHERGRFNAGNISPLNINDNIPLVNYSELVKMDLVKISPKLRGYQFGSVNKLTLSMISFDNTTGIYDGYLGSWDGNVLNAITHKGPITTGKKGEITRFYDETNIDYIDIVFDINTTVSDFTNQKIDIQLFPTLSLDNQVMLIGTFQYNDVSNVINRVRDERQFGNTSEKELSTSALNFISLPERVLHGNGVVRGFDLEDTNSAPNPNNGQIYLTGGEALVNGKFIQLNNETVVIPLIKEYPLYNINWALCVNSIGEYQPIPLLDYDATLSTPNNLIRVFTAFNLVNGQTYNIDASSFSDIINNRKDLTILYIVAATTTPGVGLTPPSISLDITDARKYINDGDTNLPLRLTAGNAQGNFKNPVAIINWIKYNNAFNGTAIVKGADVTTGVIDISIDLDFNNKVTIDGENNALLTFTEEVVLGSNLTFKNLNLNFTGGVSLVTTVENLSFENCVVDITISAPAVDNVIFDFVSSNNIVIKDSTFNITYNPLIPTPSPLTDLSQYGAVFRLTNTTNFIVDNSVVNATFSVNPGTNVPGDIFILITSDGVIIKDSNFNGNFNRCVANSNSNNLQFKDCVVTSTFNPDLTLADFGFDSTDFINSGQGYIYSNVDSTLSNIIIDNCSFNYSPAGVPTSNPDLGNRFSFINFELTSNTSVLSGLLINNCKFNHTNVGGETEDYRAAIAIINTCSASGVPTLPSAQQPLLINANIIKNTCNRNQTIVVTSKLNNDGYMVYPGLAAINCNIKENVCGLIGYWISSGTKIVNISPDINAFNDKNTGLSIKDNTCHDITNVHSKGLYFLVSDISDGTSLNKCSYPSGYVTIDNNKCNWIHVSIAYEESSSLNIINNALTAYSLDYLVYQVGDDTPNTLGFSNQYAIFVHTNKYESNPITSPKDSNDVSVHIMNNTISAGYWYQSNFVASNYKYGRGFIFCTASNIISGNNCRGAIGIEESENENHLILISGTNNIVKNNFIYREGLDCTSYIGFNNYDSPIWDGTSIGTNTSTIIVDNYFDSPYVSNSTLLDINYSSSGDMTGVIQLPNQTLRRAIVERNHNQTGIALIPLTNHYSGYDIFGFIDRASFGGETDTSAGSMEDYSNTNVFNGTYRSQVLKIVDASGSFRMLGFQESIEKYLPQNVRLISLRAGLRAFGNTVDYSINALTITAATNASPIAITTSVNHGLITGTKVTITGVTGNTAANGVFTITSTGLTTFTLDGSTGNGAYVGGGTVYPDVNAATSNFWLNICRIDPYLTSTEDVTNLDYFSSATDTDTSIAELDSPVYSLITGGQVNATSVTIPFSINFENYSSSDISYNYVTGRGRSISLAADFRFDRTSPNLEIVISPVEIKYRW